MWYILRNNKLKPTMTPQEAADKHASGVTGGDYRFSSDINGYKWGHYRHGFIDGAQWQSKQDNQVEWIKTSDQLPSYNKGVIVFIPEEDNHITAGMYDISNKWILLDEYRQPQSQVTHWREMPSEPEDKSYEKSFVHTDELETMSGIIRTLNKKVFDGDQALSSALKEIAKLTSWKNEMLQLWNKLDAYIETRKDIRLGESKVDFAIKIMKERDELHAKIKELVSKPNNFM